MFEYNTKTKELKKLISNLRFANGVAIHQDLILVSETTGRTIMFYNTKTKETGQFMKDLPCLPDNIRQVSQSNPNLFTIGCSVATKLNVKVIASPNGAFQNFLKSSILKIPNSLVHTAVTLFQPGFHFIFLCKKKQLFSKKKQQHAQFKDMQCLSISAQKLLLNIMLISQEVHTQHQK